ncbi:unnamed protein product [Hydatigera taeniaeformis]|uniref:Meiotic nuclear division protein 1 homolog n=1 Tax=Hydatigena taeniaeformis TaxID=6205 RepID=A0A0R3X2D9_HYDTA|nr:unnamed protein product [Hydatigera taeniaeformis]
MSRRRGLSVEEKRMKMMELFYEKELERVSHKEKGIPSMTVKDILMGLVSDGLVDSDKIGTSIYFWAFPSKAGQSRREKIGALESEISDLKSRLVDLEQTLEMARANKEKTVEREEALSALSENQSLLEELKSNLTHLKQHHPNRIRELSSQTETAIECANRWTGKASLLSHLVYPSDNIFQIIGWIKNRFGVDDAALVKQFHIPDNLDYIET